MPYALDKTTWTNLLAGNASDKYRFNADSETVASGTDGILEANLFPQGTGSPGNRGTVDIGSSNNSTADIRRQIRDGISSEDLEYLGGKIELNSNGQLSLNGDTGISAGVQNDFQAIVGQTRIIPLFSSVTGPGNNAVYTIIGFAGVRVMNVKLTGSQNSKQVIVQPANVLIHGAIPGSGTVSPTSFVYSHAWLVR